MGRGKMGRKVEDAIQVLKHIKSLKGDYKGYAEHANSRDIHIISGCCYNLLKDNIPLYASQKKKIKIFLEVYHEEINVLSSKKASVKKKREILSNPQIGPGILIVLTKVILPALVSALAREKPDGIDEAGSSGSGVCGKVGKHKQVECRICLKAMRSDTLKRHMKTHEKKSNEKDEAGSSGSGVCENAGKHKQAECRICLKTMRSDNLVRHMKTHEKKQVE